LHHRLNEQVSLEVERMGGKTTMFDPYCFAAAEERLGRECFKHSFEDIANGMVEGHGPFSAVICSFALHLLDESYLPALLAVLSGWTSVLIGKAKKKILFVFIGIAVLTPHKKPHLKEEWGFKLTEEFVENRVRLRRYEKQ